MEDDKDRRQICPGCGHQSLDWNPRVQLWLCVMATVDCWYCESDQAHQQRRAKLLAGG